MRILDSEGRLFGKINIIDFSVIAILLVIIGGMLIMGWRLYQYQTWPPCPAPQPCPPTLPTSPPVQKTYEQQYNELITEQAKIAREKEYEEKFMQLKENIGAKDIELENLLKGYRIILRIDKMIEGR